MDIFEFQKEWNRIRDDTIRTIDKLIEEGKIILKEQESQKNLLKTKQNKQQLNTNKQ